ncbi:hypothetical protein [Microbacterium aurantiacum]|uniref:hypothetical protein n=1 Tax=Microbacterium aurantiacum TaxID=162393 RepID=UPI000C8031CE|nr:hypothetical protein [Microbacterium aurantiacum]
MTASLRQLLTHVEPSYEMPLHDGWERMPADDPRLADRLPKGVGSLRNDSIVVIMMPVNRESPLVFPIIERRIRGEKFGTLDALVDERIAAGARATLGDPAILRHRSLEAIGDTEGYVVRYLLATPGTGRRRGVEFLVAFPALPDEKLQLLETLYDGIIASGSWCMPRADALSPPEPFGG